MMMEDKDWGYVLKSEPQTLRQALAFINVILQVRFGKWEAKLKRNSSLCTHRIPVASLVCTYCWCVVVALFSSHAHSKKLHVQHFLLNSMLT